jgi:predicted flap endonuclease-1-like 5' DNA nuclease
LQAQLEAAQVSLQKQAGELDVLHTTLAANDEQLAVLAARARAERERKEALESILASARDSFAHQDGESQQRIGELTAEVERLRALTDLAPVAVAAEVETVAARAPVSALALLSKEEMAGLVLAAGAGQPPQGVAADRGEPDDLKIIDGIGPVNERWLHQQGVWYFWQIAAWLAPEVAWVAHHLPNFGSRVYRENWVAQAAKLAAQGDAAANAATA